MHNTSTKWIKNGSLLLLCGIGLFALAAWRGRSPPSASSFQSASFRDPEQSPPKLQPFTVERRGHTYAIEPVHLYTLQGLVVTAHDSDSVFDITHEDWNDYLNTKDICVVWGTNLDLRLLPKMEFWSGNWTCYFRTSDSETWAKFNPHQISNNHVLAADEKIAEILAKVRIGDEIRLSGHLVNYSIDAGPPRRSSVVRHDTGNGACEVFYIENAQVIARHHRFWTSTRSLGKALSLAGLLSFAIGAFVLPFTKRS